MKLLQLKGDLFLVGLAVLFFLSVSAGGVCATTAGDWSTLYGLIKNGAEPSISITDNITTGGTMPNAVGSKDIDGGGYTLSAGSQTYKGFITDYSGGTTLSIGNITLQNFNVALMTGDNKHFTSFVNIGPNVIFQNNATPAAGTSGGAAIYNQVTMNIADGTKFLNNKAQYAGAVYNYYQMTFGNDVIFNGNTATAYDGGAISMNDASGSGAAFTKIGDRAQFINNSALNDYGGAISNEGSILTIGDSANFQGNKAGMAGAIMNVYTQAEATIGDNAVFRDNTAQYAGAIANVAGATFSIGENAQFINNKSVGAGQQGGAIGNEFSALTIGAGALFDGNSATDVGGALFNLDGNITLNTAAGKATVFKNNTDSTGANDVYLLSDTSQPDAVPPVLTIAGTGGTIEFQGGIASNDDVAHIEKTSSGEMILGAAAQNKGFLGAFDQTAGLTSVYGEFFGGINNISNSTLHFLTSNAANVLNVTNGAVDLRSSGGAYNTLTANTWTASGAKLYINTYFDGNGTDTDKLVIDGGAATGDTTLFVTSKGSSGSPTPEDSDGILVVDVTNATDKSAVFSLQGGKVDTGAYEYLLNHASDDNWYLKSYGELTNTAKTIANMPALHLSLVKSSMDELRGRMGELLTNDGSKQAGFWTRAYGGKLTVDEKIYADMTIFGAEAGIDAKAVSNDSNVLYLGLMAGYIYTDNIKVKQTNMFDGTGSGRAPNAGVYAVWGNDNGWFANATARYFWAAMSMQNISAAGDVIAYDANRIFWAGSLEAGKSFRLSSFSLDPKAEARYAYADKSWHGTNMNDNVQYSDTQSILTALRLQATYMQSSKYQPFIELGVYNEWLGKTNINFAGADMKSDVSGAGAQAAAGLNMRLTGNSYLYGNVSYDKGSVYEALSGNVGIRFNF